MNKFRILTFVLAVATFVATACSKEQGSGGKDDPGEDIKEINGTVIKDGNNACGLISDSRTGKGIPGVPVSDGFKYVKTDNNGVYQMAVNSFARMVFISLPSEYEIPMNADNHPVFYSPQGISHSGKTRNDFVLTPREKVEDNFTLIGISDPQCNTNEKVQRYSSETVPDIVSTMTTEAEGEVIAITLGDVTHDNINMWKPMYSTMSNVKLSNGKYIPFFQTIGNHDHYASADSEYSAVQNFMDTFGPVDYSFNVGKAHIVSMDNIQVTTSNGKTWKYFVGYTDKQYNWLKSDFDMVEGKEDKILIFCGHGGFRNGGASGSGADVNKDAHYADFLELFKQFKEVHLLIGHRHFSQAWVHSTLSSVSKLPFYEHIEGAACGAFWNCQANLDGTPNGYTIYKIHGSQMYDWVQKGTGHDINDQMAVYDGNQEYGPAEGYKYVWYEGRTGGTGNIPSYGNSTLKGKFVASIWNGDNRYWKVEFWQDGVLKGTFSRISSENSQSNAYATSYYFNKLNLNNADYSIGTSHYWYFYPKSGYPAGEKNWEVRATQTIPASGVTHTYVCKKLTVNTEVYEGIETL